ncbi:hypothetical protein BT63DRAFT_259867 [Microthyrium microscopicum]|uniref:R3H domain protein n=1 Tax=Microthyrium microscopicum TaxID=703497 RepID=A0A6A6UDB9_9PEZI|nr:hypothetical protein BT63DRAFT_259867 [Microthyrium microscopicum]
MTSQAHDLYYENASQRSPGSHRQHSHLQNQQRQQSRPFDGYGTMPPPPNLYAPDEHGFPAHNLPRYDGRMNATLGAGYPGYDNWGNAGPFASGQNNTLAAIGATTRRNPMGNRPARSGLPSNWVDPQPMPGMPSFTGLDPSHDDQHMRGGGERHHHDIDEELIPTAIVIKNIPFAVKKEQLVSVMTELGLPLPYAFNYHFDQGVFRGLAFANFTTSEETALVINQLNHYDLAGRKLRVEYKKMLPLAERERIEREKRIKRGQLEEQHRPLQAAAQLQNQTSLSSLASNNLQTNSPSPVSSRPRLPGIGAPGGGLDLRSLQESSNIDFNDPAVLNIYSELVIFQRGPEDEMTFPPNLSPTQRRMVHTLAHHLRLGHMSRGTGQDRAVHIFRVPEQAQVSPSNNLPTGHPVDTHRRALNRAATTDFSDVRSDGFYGGPTVARQASGVFGAYPDSPNGLHASANLRSAKSFADLRAYTPSPVPSTASFPAGLSNNLARFTEYGGTAAASNPNLTSTSGNYAAGRDEALLVNGLNGMGLGGGFGPGGGSPRSTRNLWDRDTPAPIGSNRAFSATTQSLEDPSQSRGLNHRQPRGPAPERGPAYGRRVETQRNGHNGGRTSDELSPHTGVDLGVDQ